MLHIVLQIVARVGDVPTLSRR